ncbi:hypothetical protein FGO68_gene11542 [Halteria grandinella]|uniref:Uncharacterized protein n=1 Tax=Halteria grandinella TaxID=5974 RepID=A0A8J8SWT0_HALGN|nr:hypothetical protein FGO68_gene11542 [Halteria grandinella]
MIMQRAKQGSLIVIYWSVDEGMCKIEKVGSTDNQGEYVELQKVWVSVGGEMVSIEDIIEGINVSSDQKNPHQVKIIYDLILNQEKEGSFFQPLCWHLDCKISSSTQYSSLIMSSHDIHFKSMDFLPQDTLGQPCASFNSQILFNFLLPLKRFPNYGIDQNLRGIISTFHHDCVASYLSKRLGSIRRKQESRLPEYDFKPEELLSVALTRLGMEHQYSLFLQLKASIAKNNVSSCANDAPKLPQIALPITNLPSLGKKRQHDAEVPAYISSRCSVGQSLHLTDKQYNGFSIRQVMSHWGQSRGEVYYLIKLNGTNEKIIIVSEKDISHIRFEKTLERRLAIEDYDLVYNASLLVMTVFDYILHDKPQLLCIDIKSGHDTYFPIPQQFQGEKIYQIRGYLNDHVLVAITYGILLFKYNRHHSIFEYQNNIVKFGNQLSQMQLEISHNPSEFYFFYKDKARGVCGKTQSGEEQFVLKRYSIKPSEEQTKLLKQYGTGNMTELALQSYADGQWDYEADELQQMTWGKEKCVVVETGFWKFYDKYQKDMAFAMGDGGRVPIVKEYYALHVIDYDGIVHKISKEKEDQLSILLYRKADVRLIQEKSFAAKEGSRLCLEYVGQDPYEYAYSVFNLDITGIDADPRNLKVDIVYQQNYQFVTFGNHTFYAQNKIDLKKEDRDFLTTIATPLGGLFLVKFNYM